MINSKLAIYFAVGLQGERIFLDKNYAGCVAILRQERIWGCVRSS